MEVWQIIAHEKDRQSKQITISVTSRDDFYSESRILLNFDYITTLSRATFFTMCSWLSNVMQEQLF